MNNVHTQQKNPKSGTTEKSPTKQAVLLNKWSEKEEKRRKEKKKGVYHSMAIHAASNMTPKVRISNMLYNIQDL